MLLQMQGEILLLLGDFCSPKLALGAWELCHGEGWCSSWSTSWEGDGAVGQLRRAHTPILVLQSPSHTCTSHLSAHSPPTPLLWGACHLFVQQMGHLGREGAAALPPRGCKHPLLTHTHTGSLYLTNNYLTKYANNIITVICLAVISV